MKCCFCGKELPERCTWNNPEPLNQECDTVCCSDCNVEYVIPVRRILWCSWVTKEEYDKLLSLFKSVPLEELKTLLVHNDELCAIDRYKEFLKIVFDADK